jgi:hypothetical protein
MKHLQLFENFLAESEPIKYYPESGLHTLVQASIHSAFEALKKRYPQLTDTDCRKGEDRTIKLYYTYKGKQLSTRLNLTGDTYTKVMQDVGRRIDPPVHNKARFINTTGYRY